MENLFWFKPMNPEQQQVDLEYSRNSIYSLKTIVNFFPASSVSDNTKTHFGNYY